jgi:hypothetical protein
MEPAGEKHVRFTKWAKEQGVQINKKISPVHFPGRGVGIAAQKPIKVSATSPQSVSMLKLHRLVKYSSKYLSPRS